MLLALPAVHGQPATVAPPQLGTVVALSGPEEFRPASPGAIHLLELGLAALSGHELPDDDVHTDAAYIARALVARGRLREGLGTAARSDHLRRLRGLAPARDGGDERAGHFYQGVVAGRPPVLLDVGVQGATTSRVPPSWSSSGSCSKSAAAAR